MAVFMLSASVAWASFNYDSRYNSFLIDSTLKTDGDYILVGDALSGYCEDPSYINQNDCETANSVWHEALKGDEGSESTAFFAVSNNLIFLDPAGIFTTDESNPTRQMAVHQLSGESFLKTNTITVTSPFSDFRISAKFGALELKSDKIIMKKNFIVNDAGLIFMNNFPNPSPNTIYVDKVLADSFNLFSGETELVVGGDNQFTITSGGTANVEELITLDGNKFCTVETWDITDDIANAKTNKRSSDQAEIACGGDQLSCCPDGYFVFDLDVYGDGTEASMVCCKAKEEN